MSDFSLSSAESDQWFEARAHQIDMQNVANGTYTNATDAQWRLEDGIAEYEHFAKHTPEHLHDPQPEDVRAKNTSRPVPADKVDYFFGERR